MVWLGVGRFMFERGPSIQRFLSFLSAPVSLDVTVPLVFLLYLREQLQEFRFYKGLMWLMSCLGLGRITNWFWRDRNI